MDWTKEKELIHLIEKLLVLGEKAAVTFGDSFSNHLKNIHDGTFHFGVDSLNKIESAADDVINEIITKLYTIAIPLISDDLVVLINRFDSIIDDMTHLLQKIINCNATPYEQLRDLYNQLLEITLQCTNDTIELIRLFFTKHNHNSILTVSESVSTVESRADAVEDTLIKTLFESELSDTEKLNESSLISLLGMIPNRCEDVADHISIFNLKIAE